MTEKRNVVTGAGIAGARRCANPTQENLVLPGTENPGWELHTPAFNNEHMYAYVEERAQAAGLNQTLAALPLMRGKHRGQFRQGMLENVPYETHPLTLACHALAMGIADDDVLAAALLHDVIEDTPHRSGGAARKRPRPGSGLPCFLQHLRRRQGRHQGSLL